MNGARTAALAAAMLWVTGCAATPVDQTIRDRWVGKWVGYAPEGRRMEARIESISDDRTVHGAGCWVGYSGWINGMRLERREDPVTVNGKGTGMAFDAGGVEFDVQAHKDGTLSLWERRAKDGTESQRQTLMITMRRSETLECAHRYRAEGQPIEDAPLAKIERELARLHPLEGVWSGRWETGVWIETHVESVEADGTVQGRSCKYPETDKGRLTLFDWGGRARTARVEEDGMLVTEGPERPGTQHRTTYRRTAEGVLEMAIAQRELPDVAWEIGPETLRMERGASAEGCLAWSTEPEPAEPLEN